MKIYILKEMYYVSQHGDDVFINADAFTSKEIAYALAKRYGAEYSVDEVELDDIEYRNL